VSKEQGTVKWFNASKALASFSARRGRCIRTFFRDSGGRLQVLNDGQAVEFEVVRGPKGLQASNVQPL